MIPWGPIRGAVLGVALGESMAAAYSSADPSIPAFAVWCYIAASALALIGWWCFR